MSLARGRRKRGGRHEGGLDRGGYCVLGQVFVVLVPPSPALLNRYLMSSHPLVRRSWAGIWCHYARRLNAQMGQRV